MTKRRPNNKKPTGLNRYLGNSLLNEREKLRRQYRKKQQAYEAENIAEIKNVAQNIDSVTDETGLEEFLAKAELAKTNFTADRGELRLLDLRNSKIVLNATNAALSMDELYKKYGDRLRIPRRPPKCEWETADDLTQLENEYFLEWRKNLADLQEGHSVILTPYERNLELWRQLWRVIERSDIIIQILDARNPLLFRNLDLEAYVKECDATKQNMYLINKTDLLSKEQIESWRKWFLENNIDAIFEIDTESPSSADDEKEIKNEEQNFGESSNSKNEDDDNGELRNSDQSKNNSSEANPSQNDEKIPVMHCAARSFIADVFARKTSRADIILKSRSHIQTSDTERRPLVVGMVGYPNVGKSSTINKLLSHKKVSVSATPGKTRHLQTLIVDDELTLCDCPGLVMPSFALSRSEMILNGILSIDHMREYLSPVELLLTRVPRKYFEKIYSVMLTSITDDDGDEETLVSAHDLLTAIAFIRGYMSSAGVADCSRAARLVLKDVVNGKVKWVAAPPNIDQKEFDKLTYSVLDAANSVRLKPNSSIMQQLEKRHLLQDMKASDKLLDEQFFLGSSNQVHVRSLRSMPKDFEYLYIQNIPALLRCYAVTYVIDLVI
ncbi:Large subunit GTPase 1 [Dirofilaria immitis]|nr:Large subunit GTPase 1 [Dirofilaria immitis]